MFGRSAFRGMRPFPPTSRTDERLVAGAQRYGGQRRSAAVRSTTSAPSADRAPALPLRNFDKDSRPEISGRLLFVPLWKTVRNKKSLREPVQTILHASTRVFLAARELHTLHGERVQTKSRIVFPPHGKPVETF
ncbi:MAG: hypothetical protein ACLU9S_21625 [Oscillospiraceae bacterium]